MRLSSVLPSLLLAPAIFAGQPAAQSWGELSQTVRPDWTVRIVLPDGTAVDGKAARFEPEFLLMRVVHTSDKSLHPKGDISIPRTQVKVVEIRTNRHNGRRLGTLIPIAAGAGISIYGATLNDSQTWFPGIVAAATIGVGIGVALIGGTAGYFIGRAADLRFETVSVAPPPATTNPEQTRIQR